MLDIKLIRENPEEIRKAIANKKFTCNFDAFLACDRQYLEQLQKTEKLRNQQNTAGDKIAQMDKSSTDFRQECDRLKNLAQEIKKAEQNCQALEMQWKSLLLSIPNLPHYSVPEGKTEKENRVHASWGESDKVSPYAIPHFDLPKFHYYLDFPRGSKVTGAGFPFYRGPMAQYVRALIHFFLTEAQKNGYTEVLSPILVNTASATATGALPDKEGMMYYDSSDDFYLIPTAEVPVTNFYRDEVLSEEDLPQCFCAYTPCFRREAGSWGKEVRGLNRLHQFDKVELVKWVHPDHSFEELELLRKNAEGLLQKLELPYRVLEICTGDIGFPHAKQYDLEVWAAGQKRWLEVSSCSNFTDFQARRANIRFRSKTGKLSFVHTLNGSGLAIPRVLAALLENRLTENCEATIPSVLQDQLLFDKINFKD